MILPKITLEHSLVDLNFGSTCLAIDFHIVFSDGKKGFTQPL